MICCGFIACWSINSIFLFLNTVGLYNVDFSGWFYHFTVVLVLVNSCINPFIYAAKYREFQKGVRRLLPTQVHPVAQAGSHVAVIGAAEQGNSGPTGVQTRQP